MTALLTAAHGWSFNTGRGVYTTNNHSQQGHAKFVLQNEGV